jgi:predicted acyltransferase
MKRFTTLDTLRGLSIFGMVFSGTIPHGTLPAWMYHIQNPPPNHTLDSTQFGLGWVDLVFPIFIFCMGVAIPFSFRAKWEKFSKNTVHDMRGIAVRFLRLLAFSFLCVLLRPPYSAGYGSYFLALIGFASLWFIYVKGATAGKQIAGSIAAITLLSIYHVAFKVPVSLFKRDIIILLLAFLYLFGSLIWYATRDSEKWRLFSFLGVVAISLISRTTGFDGLVYNNKHISWLLNMEQINFLMILLPATWVGDRLVILQKENNLRIQHKGWLTHLLFWCLLAVVVWICISSYNRWLLAGKLVSLVTLAGLIFLMSKKAPRFLPFLYLATLLILSGLWMEQLEPGLTKVPCSFSYCFVSGGIALLLLLWLHYMSECFPQRFLGRVFSGAGANPLMSYVAHGLFIVPLMGITYIKTLYQWARPVAYPWVGTLSAFLVVLFTMWAVSLVSRKKIYWRA